MQWFTLSLPVDKEPVLPMPSYLWGWTLETFCSSERKKRHYTALQFWLLISFNYFYIITSNLYFLFWEEEYRTIPGAGLNQESGRKWWKEPSAARVLGEVSRGCCLPGVLLDAAALGLTQVQWRSTWQACCLGRIPFFCIQSVSGGSFMFLPGMGAWDGPATFAGGIDLGCTKNISDSVPWSPWCQVTWGKQESEMGSLLLFASAQLTLCWALYLYILI